MQLSMRSNNIPAVLVSFADVRAVTPPFLDELLRVVRGVFSAERDGRRSPSLASTTISARRCRSCSDRNKMSLAEVAKVDSHCSTTAPHLAETLDAAQEPEGEPRRSLPIGSSRAAERQPETHTACRGRGSRARARSRGPARKRYRYSTTTSAALGFHNSRNASPPDRLSLDLLIIGRRDDAGARASEQWFRAPVSSERMQGFAFTTRSRVHDRCPRARVRRVDRRRCSH